MNYIVLGILFIMNLSLKYFFLKCVITKTDFVLIVYFFHCRCHDKMGIPICGACRRPIEERVVTALGKHWHVEHFVCAKCEKPFLGNRHYERKVCFNSLQTLTWHTFNFLFYFADVIDIYVIFCRVWHTVKLTTINCSATYATYVIKSFREMFLPR